MRAIRSTDPRQRAQAVDLLARFDDPRCAELIVAAFHDENPVVRSHASDVLVAKRWDEPLRAGLNSPRAEVRAEAADALGDLGDDAAVPVLIDALRDPSVAVRGTAAYALGDLRDLRAVSALIRLLSDPEPAARRIATYALGNIGDPAAIEGILDAAADPDPQVREAASSAVHKLEQARSGVSYG